MDLGPSAAWALGRGTGCPPLRAGAVYIKYLTGTHGVGSRDFSSFVRLPIF